ncbi:alkaline phosphatase family protein [Haloferula sargassicola]|uniref:Beta-barrel assembly-enhancing protease n=1 Tax=Haloferula sargassicola TaxID=490096 RepID=A0ABP9UT02_9BACT
MARKRLLLVGWDSADWQIIHPLLDAGRMPGLQRIVDAGVSGNLATLEPQLSPMLWTTIATGKMAYHHGVHGFTEVDPAGSRVVPVSAATRQCATVWEILEHAGLKSHVVGWFATHGERGGKGGIVSNLFPHLGWPSSGPEDWPPPPPGTYWPESLGKDLDPLRVSPAEITEDILRAFVPRAPEIDQSTDRRLHFLAERLAEAYSIQSAATYLMETAPDWDFMAVYFRAMDEISHAFMPFHPPRMQGVPECDFEIYQDVVAATYQAHDMMLQRLMHLAGPDATVMVVSDHGFHSDHLRPRFTPRVPAGITVWHRAQGIFAASGPEWARDQLVHGARLLDIAPTILHHFGLPVGSDMEGRVLAEVFADPAAVRWKPTWEIAEVARRHPRLPKAADDALLQQFVALGYIDEVSDDAAGLAATERENRWNLARACLYGGKLEMALELLEKCLAAAPERADYAQLLARTQLKLGLVEEAEETLHHCLQTLGPGIAAHLLLAGIAISRGNPREALESLSKVAEQEPRNVDLLRGMGEACLALRRWTEAEEIARRIREIDPGDSTACFLLARCMLRQGRPDDAMEAALEAIGLQYGNPQAHFLLGIALVRLGEPASAETALLRCLTLDPSHRPAARHLTRVQRLLGRPDAEALEREARARRVAETAAFELRRQRLRQRPKLPLAPAQSSSKAFTLVSGLPRSGTSLMMQILRAAGVPIMHDDRRPADEDNPEGYWEWEGIRSLRKKPALIEQAEGKVVKVISALLPSLPPEHRYRILFMRRPVEEVVASQTKMLARQRPDAPADDEDLVTLQTRHLAGVLKRLRGNPRIELLEIQYHSLIHDPLPELRRILDFVGAPAEADPVSLVRIIRPGLHRNRS